jgi:hypothetical protein
MMPPIVQISDEIRTIYRQEGDTGYVNIEAYLEKLLGTFPGPERLEVLQTISEQFTASTVSQPLLSTETEDQLLRFISLLLGQQVDAGKVANKQLQEKLCASLGVIFDGLNDLLQAINGTLNRDNQFDETIRHVLRKQLDEIHDDKPLEAYIDQIRKSFFASYESFKEAHLLIIGKVLEELSPEKSINKCAGGLKFGALRKAEAFDQYTQLYDTLQAWHESGRGLEEYLRTFEKQCSDKTRT